VALGFFRPTRIDRLSVRVADTLVDHTTHADLWLALSLGLAVVIGAFRASCEGKGQGDKSTQGRIVMVLRRYGLPFDFSRHNSVKGAGTRQSAALLASHLTAIMRTSLSRCHCCLLGAHPLSLSPTSLADAHPVAGTQLGTLTAAGAVHVWPTFGVPLALPRVPTHPARQSRGHATDDPLTHSRRQDAESGDRERSGSISTPTPGWRQRTPGRAVRDAPGRRGMPAAQERR